MTDDPFVFIHDETVEELRQQDVNDLALWCHPEMPSVEDVLEWDSAYATKDVECPDPDCTNEIPLQQPAAARAGEDPERVERDLVELYAHYGTVRCAACYVPLYGIRGYRTGSRGDYK